jgi:transcriptional regulator with XRE-family HTH domain
MAHLRTTAGTVEGMARRATHDPAIGGRIKTRRKALGWSIRFAASRAGLSHTSWSRIERGEQSADNRFILAAIAEALRCSVLDLAGQPGFASDVDQAAMEEAAYETVRAIVEADLDYEPTTKARPIPALAREIDLIRDLRVRCDFLGLNRRLPAALRELHAAAAGADREQALALMVQATEAANYAVRFTTQRAAANLVAERGKQAARFLGDPVMNGLAAWTLAQAAQSCGLYRRALTVAERAAEELTPQESRPHALEMRGQLLMSGAYSRYALGEVDAALTLVDEASRLAERTGDTDTFGLFFGPTNINIWRISMTSDGGEPGKAMEIARNTNPAAIQSPSRQTSFYLDTGRALARLRRDEPAVRQLLIAERLAPQRVRTDPLVAETARSLLERARRNAGGAELRGLCERVGALT